MDKKNIQRLDPQTPEHLEEELIFRRLEFEIENLGLLSNYDGRLVFHGIVDELPDVDSFRENAKSKIGYGSNPNCVFGANGYMNHFFYERGIVVHMFVTRG